jgi:hypothetical protein
LASTCCLLRQLAGLYSSLLPPRNTLQPTTVPVHLQLQLNHQYLYALISLAGSKDPKTLVALVKALGLAQERVNADLMTYKGVLSKLEGAKEIMKVRRNRCSQLRGALGRCSGGQTGAAVLRCTSGQSGGWVKEGRKGWVPAQLPAPG